MNLSPRAQLHYIGLGLGVIALGLAATVGWSWYQRHSMTSAVSLQLLHDPFTKYSSLPACMALKFVDPAPESVGTPGAANVAVPGQHALTLALKVSPYKQAARHHQLDQLDYLAGHGLLEKRSVDSTAVSYHLTWDAVIAGTQAHDNELCLPYGPHHLSEIEDYARWLMPGVDLPAYEVHYRAAMQPMPAWADSDEGRRLFPEAAVRPIAGSIKVLDTDHGWRPYYEAEFPQARTTASPLPSLASAGAILAGIVATPQWQEKDGIACLPLGTTESHDGTDAASFAYYDDWKRNKADFEGLATSLHVLNALTAMGLAQSETTRPMPWRQSTTPEAAKRAGHGGVRYRIDENWGAFRREGKALCLILGRVEASVMGVTPAGVYPVLHLKAAIVEPSTWANAAAAQLPAVQAILDRGFAMKGHLRPTAANASPSQWVVDRWEAVYPAPHYAAFPVSLRDFFPETLHVYSQSAAR